MKDFKFVEVLGALRKHAPMSLSMIKILHYKRAIPTEDLDAQLMA